MQKIGFAEAVDRIVAEDPRYHRDVYSFVRDALDFTVKQQKKNKEAQGITRHVTPRQLLDGIRMFALKEFGPMVPTVFGYWNLRSCEDLGYIVFNMIRKEILGKNDRIRSTSFGTATISMRLSWFRSFRKRLARRGRRNRNRYRPRPVHEETHTARLIFHAHNQFAVESRSSSPCERRRSLECGRDAWIERKIGAGDSSSSRKRAGMDPAERTYGHY